MQVAGCSMRQYVQNRLMSTKWGSFRPKSGGQSSKSSGKAKRAEGEAGKAKKSGAKAKGGAGSNGGNQGPAEIFTNMTYLLATYLIYTFVSEYAFGLNRSENIDFQTFRTEVLARDIVDKVCLWHCWWGSDFVGSISTHVWTSLLADAILVYMR
jgi:hypothetical protein